MVAEESVLGWSKAIRQVEVLEPWLTASQTDEHYWDDVARIVVEQAGERPSRTAAGEALRAALRVAFPDTALEADNGMYCDDLDGRLDLIVELALQTR